MEKILISACLLGLRCRYDAKSVAVEEIRELAARYGFIPVCPEQLGGLPTPRVPCERLGDKVIGKNGIDATQAYTLGAQQALQICKLYDIHYAILKARSPSCGSGIIYDGTFSGNKIPGDGVTAALLKANGIRVFTEFELNELKEALRL